MPPLATPYTAAAAGAGEQGLIGWCRHGLAHFKPPRRIVFIDGLPKTAADKLLRFKVREQLTGQEPPDPGATPTAGAGASA